MPDESARTVLVGLVTGIGVSLAKVGATALTGSSAMAAEASHSLADNVNDLLVFVAQRRGSSPPDARYPLGYGRETYFWTLIASLGVLVAAAIFSLVDGIDELIHPSVTSSFAVAYVVLVIATVFTLASFRQSAGQMSRRARHYHRELLEESRVTSEPSLRAVFLNDAASIFGNVIAFAGLALNQITGSSIPQGVAAVLIALMMIFISLRLIRRSHDFLVGAWVWAEDRSRDPGGFTQPLRPAEEERIRAFILGTPV
jgi:cation diffusion facilitator family transporter